MPDETPKIEETPKKEETPTNQSPAQDGTQPAPNTSELYLATIREKAQQNLELQRRINELESKKQEPTKVESTDWFKDPDTYIGKKVEEAMTRVVGPLAQQFAQSQFEGKYDKMKDKFRNDPRYKMIFPKIESEVDAMALQPGINLSLETLGLIVDARAGNYMLNNPTQNFTRTESTKDDPKPTLIDPPHIRSAAPAPTNAPAKKVEYEFSENERHLMRVNKMTEEEWLKNLNLPSHEIGVKKEEAKK